MKINVDGNKVTIDYDCNQQNTEPEIDIAPVQEQKQHKTRLDVLKNIVAEELRIQLKMFESQGSFSVVQYSGNSTYIVGTDVNWALNQLSVIYNQPLDWADSDGIMQWLDEEIDDYE